MACEEAGEEESGRRAALNVEAKEVGEGERGEAIAACDGQDEERTAGIDEHEAGKCTPGVEQEEEEEDSEEEEDEEREEDGQNEEAYKIGNKTDVDDEDGKEEEDAGEREREHSVGDEEVSGDEENTGEDPAKNNDDSSMLTGDGVLPGNASEHMASELEGLALSKLGSCLHTAEIENNRCDGVSNHSDVTVCSG